MYQKGVGGSPLPVFSLVLLFVKNVQTVEIFWHQKGKINRDKGLRTLNI